MGGAWTCGAGKNDEAEMRGKVDDSCDGGRYCCGIFALRMGRMLCKAVKVENDCNTRRI